MIETIMPRMNLFIGLGFDYTGRVFSQVHRFSGRDDRLDRLNLNHRVLQRNDQHVPDVLVADVHCLSNERGREPEAVQVPDPFRFGSEREGQWIDLHRLLLGFLLRFLFFDLFGFVLFHRLFRDLGDLLRDLLDGGALVVWTILGHGRFFLFCKSLLTYKIIIHHSIETVN